MLKKQFISVMKSKAARYSDEYIERAWIDSRDKIEDWFKAVLEPSNELTLEDKINKFLDSSVESYRGSDAEKQYIKNEMFEEMMFAAIEDNRTYIFS